MASLEADSLQFAILGAHQAIQEAGTRSVPDMSDLPTERKPVVASWHLRLNTMPM